MNVKAKMTIDKWAESTYFDSDSEEMDQKRPCEKPYGTLECDTNDSKNMNPDHTANASSTASHNVKFGSIEIDTGTHQFHFMYFVLIF